MTLIATPVLATSIKAFARSVLFSLGVDHVLMDFLAHTAIGAELYCWRSSSSVSASLADPRRQSAAPPASPIRTAFLKHSRMSISQSVRLRAAQALSASCRSKRSEDNRVLKPIELVPETEPSSEMETLPCDRVCEDPMREARLGTQTFSRLR